MKNEKQIKIHFIGYWPSWVLILGALGSLLISMWISLDLLGLAIFYTFALKFLIHNIKIKFEKSQISVRYGIFNVQSFNLPYNKIQSTVVEQDFLGRILDFADVIIIGMGQSKLVLHEIKHPFEIQKMIADKMPQQIIEVNSIKNQEEKEDK